jgi:SPP1 family predicted phage head-tail adaptor
MRSGWLRKKITIESFTPSIDAYGEHQKTWTTYCIRQATIEHLRGREYWEAQQIVAENTVRFRLRYDGTTKNITPKMRVLYDSRYFDIVMTQNIKEKNKELVLLTTEQRDD